MALLHAFPMWNVLDLQRIYAIRGRPQQILSVVTRRIQGVIPWDIHIGVFDRIHFLHGITGHHSCVPPASEFVLQIEVVIRRHAP
ncbi:hypothetical protein A0H81_08370 [Grifola frondosa]|uniref:Uncharacterized protein n=1 Tax=Grifola frondosa TaxID=5627 RepID=A0A1C7M406_GRIFR|nr:hypothetical protein A0H81_08370 [Grifola frondosa]